MLDKLYITPRQWLHILRWALYALLLLTAMMLQTVVLGNRTLLGTHPDFVPVVITCVCLREGAERGGLFALLASLFWYLSGADQGSLSIAVLTIVPVAGTLLCSQILSERYFTSLALSFLTLLVQQCLIFAVKSLFGAMDGKLFLTTLLPCVFVSVLSQPIVYFLTRCINRIGDKYEST